MSKIALLCHDRQGFIKAAKRALANRCKAEA
jgi:hypothetical protein